MSDPTAPAEAEHPRVVTSTILPRNMSDDDRLMALLVHGLALDGGEAPTGERVAMHRKEAARMLTEHAFRALHNHVAEIRRDAIAEHLASMRPPPGFPALFAACAAAVSLSFLAMLWLLADPARLAALVGAFTR